MSIVRCLNGHFFDNEKSAACPWCQSAAGDTTAACQAEAESAKTVAVPATQGAPQARQVFPSGDSLKTEALGTIKKMATSVRDFADAQKTEALNTAHRRGGAQEGATVAIIRKQIGIDPVVGWLVCIKGPERGRDYRIHTEKNSIGRSDSMDIVIRGDDTISRVNHAFLSHNPKKNTFRIMCGEGRSLIYVDGEEVSPYAELKPRSVIEIGEGTFVFVPFNSDDFEWKQEDNKE